MRSTRKGDGKENQRTLSKPSTHTPDIHILLSRTSLLAVTRVTTPPIKRTCVLHFAYINQEPKQSLPWLALGFDLLSLVIDVGRHFVLGLPTCSYAKVIERTGQGHMYFSSYSISTTCTCLLLPHPSVTDTNPRWDPAKYWKPYAPFATAQSSFHNHLILSALV